MKVEDIARVAHEANRAYCQTHYDTNHQPWDEAPEWVRATAINGVKFHLANPGTTPERSHENWLREKERDGWKYGEIKDPELKTHPCFRPYEELPLEQRAKDSLFQSVIDALAELID